MKEHLKKLHTSAAEHHVRVAKLFEARADQCDGEEAAHYSKMAGEHADMAEEHVAMCKSLDDMPAVSRESRTNADEGLRAAMFGDDLDKLVPTSVKAVIPDHLQMIPRAGSEVAAADDGTATIDAICGG